MSLLFLFFISIKRFCKFPKDVKCPFTFEIVPLQHETSCSSLTIDLINPEKSKYDNFYFLYQQLKLKCVG